MNAFPIATLMCATLLVAGCYSDSSRKQRAHQYAPYTGAVAEQTITRARIEHFEKTGDTAAARLEREILYLQNHKAKAANDVVQNPGLVVPQAILETTTAHEVKDHQAESRD